MPNYNKETLPPGGGWLLKEDGIWVPYESPESEVETFRNSMHPYPGSKRRMLKDLIPRIEPLLPTRQYRECFLGGGSIYAAIAGKCERGAWLNDIDPHVACLWHVVRDKDLNERMLDRVRKAPVLQEVITTKAQKKMAKLLHADWIFDLDAPDLIEVAFAKLKLHAHTFGGAGVQGGARNPHKPQKDGRPNHRWSPRTIIPAATALNFRMWLDNTRITCDDYMPMLEDPTPAVLYLDPPYVEAGEACYDFGSFDHDRLAAALKECPHPWVLSYDGHPLIHELYGDWCEFHVQELDSYISHGPGRASVKTELIITPTTKSPGSLAA